MGERVDLPPINYSALNDALLAQADSLVALWLPGGVVRGHEYVCGSLHGGTGGSCSVNLSNGRWSDFAVDEAGGDLVSLYAAINGLDNGKAAVQLAREYRLEGVAGIVKREIGSAASAAPVPRPVVPAPAAAAPPARHAAESEGWAVKVPVPAHAPEPTFRHYSRSVDDIAHKAEYRIGDDLYGYVVRFSTSDGGKDTLPYTWCESARDGASRWHWKTWDEPRPLYMPSKAIPGQRTVVLVEGERKAEVLQALLDAAMPNVYAVVSWVGGCKAWKKAQWDWLKGCTVLLWPDCDAKRVPLTKPELGQCLNAAAVDMAKAKSPLLAANKQPGMAAMLGIGALLQAAQDCKVTLLPIPEPGAVADGWDCADAIETDNWDASGVLAFFGKAQPLPLQDTLEAVSSSSGKPAAPSGAGNGGKKPPLPAGGAGDGDSGGPGGAPWWLAAFWIEKKTGGGYWAVSRKLVIAALRHDPAVAGILGLNELTNNIDARKTWPWMHGAAGQIKGSTALMLSQYLSDTYGLPSIPVQALEEAIATVAQSSRYHPVREYLQDLQHDGVTRIDKWLVHVLGESPESLKNPNMVEYLGLVGRFLLLGMVWRVMKPGCKFDYCPVLEGPGGFGKSTFVEKLASPAFFSNAHFDLTRGKEGQEQVQGIWVYELQELSSLGKAELNLIKAFISSAVDRYRPSYGRTVEAFDRQCIMVGTTNEERYLRDRTGNRRWWPVPVRKVINNPWLVKMRDQLLAEAFALYEQGVPYTPSREQEERLFVPMQESRLEETAPQSGLMDLLTRQPTSVVGFEINANTDFVTNAQICQGMGTDAAKANVGFVREIGSFMKSVGWEQKKRTVNGVRVLGYVRPAGWLAKLKAEAVAPADDWTVSKAIAVPAAAATTPTPTPPVDHNAAFDHYAQKEADDAPF